MIKRLACLLSYHDWETETQGYLFEGNVYPLKIRTCKHCASRQREMLDSEKMTVTWVKDNAEKSEHF